MGCGEARLAKCLPDYKIHSFDLVAVNERVAACDMAHTPLQDNSVDSVVFCLSLMGLNQRDYIKEANRILKDNGILKIAEVESRFKNLSIDHFIRLICKFGFELKWKDTKSDYFVFMDFKKIGSPKKKLPEVNLKPCFYKKR